MLVRCTNEFFRTSCLTVRKFCESIGRIAVCLLFSRYILFAYTICVSTILTDLTLVELNSGKYIHEMEGMKILTNICNMERYITNVIQDTILIYISMS